MDAMKNPDIPADLIQELTAEQAWHYRIVPFLNENGTLHCYTDQQGRAEVQMELEILLGKSFALTEAADINLQALLGKYYRRGINKQQLSLEKGVDFVDQILSEAHQLNASDIHIEAYEEAHRVRYRMDGKLIEKYVLDASEFPGLVNKIKVRANLDIAEKRRPQDGRIRVKNQEADYDIRVSVVPAIFGEKIVMRLLKKDSTNIDLSYLQLNPKQAEDYHKAINNSNGIVLISGPTGSGKTTTLYASLKHLNRPDVNISTVEDPVEYTLEGINQVQLHPQIGLTFSAALKTFLRQDPDIIMLGEIRDYETAEMAIRAALTGHLVLSTIHTNSAWGTISRLIDMGVPAYLLASVLNVSVAQRLVRKLCPSCKERVERYEQRTFPGVDLSEIHTTHTYKAVGCEECYYTGYKGRQALFEIIPMDEEIREHIRNNSFQIKDLLEQKEVSTLYQQAIEIVKNGKSSLEEVYPILISKD